MSHKHFATLFVLSIALASILYVLYRRQQVDLNTDLRSCPDFQEATLDIPNHTISVALADDPNERAKGLADCTTVSPHHGMYFSLAHKEVATFWMKGMLVPIDIVWIADGTVVGVDSNVPPPRDLLDKNLPRYHSPQPVDAVLEVASGQAGKFGIGEGTTVKLNR